MPKVKIPDYLLCPISLQLMRKPVTTADGHVYEHNEIKKWLETHDTSPVTNKILPNKTLIPAYAINNVIQDFNGTLCSKSKFIDLILDSKLKELHECKYLEEYLKDQEVLSAAVQSQDLDVISWILDEGADVNGKTTELMSMLDQAIDEDALDVIKLLIQRGANIDLVDEKYGMSPIFMAKSIDALKLLVDCGCNTRIVSTEGPLQFQFASKLPLLDWVHKNLGMDMKAKSSNDGSTLLHHAAEQKSIECMKYLIDWGLDVNSTTTNKQTPLHWIFPVGRNLAKNEQDEDKNEQDKESSQNENKNTYESEDKRKCAQLLLENGALVNSKDNQGFTPLRAAVNENKIKSAEILLEYGADMFAASNKGDTPFDLAKPEMKKVLIEHYRKLLHERNEIQQKLLLERNSKAQQKTTEKQQRLEEMEFLKKTLLAMQESIEQIKEPIMKKRKK